MNSLPPSSIRRLLLGAVLALGLAPFPSLAHVGSPTVFFQGQAGPYNTQVIIRPAEVIPGLADISVRVDQPGVDQVTALPIKWNAGPKGAPPPDVARPVPGETNLYSAQLWFMEAGAHSIRIEITGRAGLGAVLVPVDAVATRVLTMPKGLGTILVVLGLALALLLLSIIGAAIRESVLDPGTEIPARRRVLARVAMASSAVILIALLWAGRQWWKSDAADYKNNRLYRPLEAHSLVRTEKGRRTLRLLIPGFAAAAPLVPDHGKLMHLFLVREPGLDAFAHLHPIKQDKRTFDAALPELPGGMYQVYADVTYETGFSDTLTNKIQIPESASPQPAISEPRTTDPDDSWRVVSSRDSSPARHEFQLAPNCTMTWRAPETIRINQPLTLRFTVRDAKGQPIPLDPYLGMRGHLALRRDDGAVFTHLHPGGTASMASMQLSTLRSEDKLPLRAAFGADDPLCRLPPMAPGEQPWLRGIDGPDTSTVSFPYAFPKPGKYRMWVQVKVKGAILTGVYDLEATGT